jgi:hypothetical protein
MKEPAFIEVIQRRTTLETAYLASAVNPRVHSWLFTSKVFAGIVPAGDT